MGQSAEELRYEIEQTRDDLGETLDAIGDRVSPGRMIRRRRNRMAGAMQTVRDRVMGTAEGAAQTVADTTYSARERAGEMAEGAVGTVRAMPDTVRQQSRGNPLLAGGIAFGVGFLVASAFPASRSEREAASGLMDKAEPLKQEIGRAAQEIGEHLKEPAKQAVENVQQAATEGAQHVAGTATEAAHRTADQAQRAAEDVRSDAPDGGPGGTTLP